MPLSVCNDGCLRRPSFIIIKQNGLGVGCSDAVLDYWLELNNDLL